MTLVLAILAAAIAALVLVAMSRRGRKRRIIVHDDRTAEIDGVRLTVGQAGLMDALRRASQEKGGDVRIGLDPTTGQVTYDVISDRRS